MRVTYAPEGGAEQVWDFDPKRVRASEAEAIERRAGESWDAWLLNVQSGQMRARRVLLWHLMRRDHPTLRYEDTPDFFAGEVVVEHTRAELEEIRERAVRAKLPPDQREQVLSALDMAIDEAREREGGGEGEGKASSKRSASATR